MQKIWKIQDFVTENYLEYFDDDDPDNIFYDISNEL